MLHAERETVLHARDSGKYDDDVLREVLAQLDVEESLLDGLHERRPRSSASWSPDRAVFACEHLDAAALSVAPVTPEGMRGVPAGRHPMGATCGCAHLRPRRLLRLLPGAARRQHFHETEHPVMRSFEPGEAWRWCYVDDGSDDRPATGLGPDATSRVLAAPRLPGLVDCHVHVMPQRLLDRCGSTSTVSAR